MIRRLILLVALLAPLRSFAADAPDPLTILADQTEVAPNGDLILTGSRPGIQTDAILLRGEEARYNPKTRIATIRGQAELTYGARRLLADTITYNLNTGAFTVENLRLGEAPLHLSAASATGNQQEITFTDARVTYREPSLFAPTLRADEIVYAPGAKLTARRAQLGVGPALPFSLRRFEHHLDQPLLSYLTVGAGYRASLGLHGELGVHVPLAPGLELGANLAYFTQRGLMFGPSGRYRSPTDPDALQGYFRSGFINDHGDKLTDVLNRPVPEERAYIEWVHRQRVNEDLTIVAQVNYWKDSAILRDFRPQSFFPVQEPDSFLESVYSGQNYFVSFFTRVQLNKFQRVQERLPELRFDLLPVALGHGIYQRFNASAVRLRDDPPLGGPELRSDRLDAYYALSRPITPREWLSITPIAGGRVTHYANIEGTSTGRERYTRVLGELGVDAELHASGVYAYRNERWKIDGLRHLVTPRLSYRYVPEGGRGRDHIPAIDRRTFSTYLPPLGLAARRHIDDLHALNVVRLGLDNTVQTRDPVYGSRDLFVFNAAADFRFDREPGERNLSEIHTQLAFMPAPWLQVDFYESFVPQDLTIREFNTAITVRDGDLWSLRFSNHFLRREIEEFVLDGSYRLNEAYEVGSRLHYDARKRRFVETSFLLRQNLVNTWMIDYVVGLYEGRRRETGFSFDVRVGLIGF